MCAWAAPDRMLRAVLRCAPCLLFAAGFVVMLVAVFIELLLTVSVACFWLLLLIFGCLLIWVSQLTSRSDRSSPYLPSSSAQLCPPRPDCASVSQPFASLHILSRLGCIAITSFCFLLPLLPSSCNVFYDKPLFPSFSKCLKAKTSIGQTWTTYNFILH